MPIGIVWFFFYLLEKNSNHESATVKGQQSLKLNSGKKIFSLSPLKKNLNVKILTHFLNREPLILQSK